MSDKPKLKVEARKLTGRKVKQLRREGTLPANIYGKGIKSVSIQLPVKDFSAVFTTAGETSIIDLTVDKETKTRPVLITNVHTHPVTDEIIHVDFRQVDLTKAIMVNIPVEIIGESPAITQGGVLIQLINEIEVEALPADLPENFTLDASKLEEIGQGFTLKDIKVSDKVKILAENLEELVVKIESPTKEEEPVVEEVPTEGEEGAEATPTEGETEKPTDGKEEKKEESTKEDKPKEEKK